jgi:hypothetical protein
MKRAICVGISVLCAYALVAILAVLTSKYDVEGVNAQTNPNLWCGRVASSQYDCPTGCGYAIQGNLDGPHGSGTDTVLNVDTPCISGEQPCTIPMLPVRVDNSY